jgi:two-component system, cell cycle sensor histidine kinase and response regulator CckA
VQQLVTHLLVVEDDPDDLLLLRNYLEEAAGTFDVFSVATAAEAEIHLTCSLVDLILLDLSLPDATGLDALRRLRRKTSTIPIVVLSGFPENYLELEAVRQGAQDYLAKSELNSQSLAKAITYALERQLLEQQLRHAQKMESVGRLAGGIAHDFNNLLTVIRANTDLLTHESGLNAATSECVRQIRETTDRAVSLVQRLLIFSRNEPPRFEVLHLNEVVSNITKLLRRILGEHVKLNLALDSTLPHIKGDPRMLEQIILNLAMNSGDAMPEGGELRIETKSVHLDRQSPHLRPDAREGDYVQLRVSDSGHGVPPETLSKIFEPFFTTKEPGKGTGLGLSIVYSIVKEHDGWIYISSTVGVGTCVDVYLPMSEETCVYVSGMSRPKPVALRNHTEATILYVEDDSTIRNLYEQLLKQAGYSVYVAESGPHALELFENIGDKLDILVSDIVMPGGMTGVQLAKMIQNRKPNVKVLLVTGYSPERIREADRGIHLLLKPFSKDQLIEKIEMLLTTSTKTAALNSSPA